MTPRQADIAFVLEGVPGVRAVYALERGSAGDLELAVGIDHGGGSVALAHYALLRVLTHEECKTVLFFEVELPPSFCKRASRLELSDTDREAARARVPLTSAALEQEPAPTPPLLPVTAPKFRILIVDADVEVSRTVVPLFGASAEGVIETNPVEAFTKARAQFFSLILCDARLAFGGNGFLRMLHRSDPARAARVLLVAHEGERDLLVTSLDELHCWTSFLCRPIDVDALLEIVMTGSIIQRWRIPIPAPRRPAEVKPLNDKVARRVLVVDDDPTTAMLLASMQGDPLDATVTSDEWEALDQIAAGAPDLVVCSVSLRTRGGTPFYRLLWNAHPELKHRFVFITRAEAAPSSTTSGRAAPVVERPLTRDVIAALLERFATS
jgi:CheY-like chemotaxis protein